MSAALDSLLDLLDLEQIERDIFRGTSRSAVVPRVFGGQVAAQALVAAGRTVPADRTAHSLHSYFLRMGDPGAPIVYSVDRIRDGRSFTTRRVVAVQHGQPIFHLSASFQTYEEGLEHQAAMPSAPDPETLPTAAQMLPRYADRFSGPGVVDRLIEARAAVDLRYVDAPPFGTVGEPREPRSQVWFRTNGKLADDPLLHVCMATYVSDMTLLDSVLLAHGRGGWAVGDVVGASLDHAMWFHRPFRADEWLLYDQESPSASGGRGLGQARIYTQDGRLAITVIQEGVVRVPGTDTPRVGGPRTAGSDILPTMSDETTSGTKTGGGESVLTVVVAALANLGIAVAKAVAGLISGSSAMLSEAAHSLADTVTELMLLTALKRSEKPADEGHPLGYGPERYIWAMLASVATFVGGAVFSIYDGVHTLAAGEELGNPLVSYIVLGVAFLLEGYSLRTGVRQVRGEAARLRAPVGHYFRHTPDTAVKAVVMEDSAALAGLLLAAGGLLGGQLTGSGVWDGIASVLIGLLLVYVAWVLGRSNAQLLIGRPVPEPMRAGIREELLSVPHIVDVLELTTLIQGPTEFLIAAKVDFRDASTADQIEWACEEAEEQLRERYPSVRRVYLDPTPGLRQRRRRAGGAGA